jgi:hypothetical protein
VVLAMRLVPVAVRRQMEPERTGLLADIDHPAYFARWHRGQGRTAANAAYTQGDALMKSMNARSGEGTRRRPGK